MPRKPKSERPVKPGELPHYVTDSKLLQRQKVTKRTLPGFSEAMMLVHTPALLREWFAALYRKVQDGDIKALQIVGEMYTYTKAKGINISVTQGMLQQNVAAGEQSPVIGFDAFARRLAEQRAGHALPPADDVVELRPAESPSNSGA